MKKWIVLGVFIVFFISGLSYGQSCGKCPSKSSCGAAKLKKEKAKIDPIVYIAKDNKSYHKKECLLIKEKTKIALSKAKEQKYEPCKVCFPAKKKGQEAKKNDTKK
jgi:hypothetical protein